MASVGLDVIDLMELDPRWRLLDYVSNFYFALIPFCKEYFIG